MKNKPSILIIAVFNLVLAGVCIYLFSPGFVGLSPRKAAFYIVLVVIIAVFLVVNYLLLAGAPKKTKLVDKNELKSPKEYIKALNDLAYKQDFTNQISVLESQIKRLAPKQASLEVILEQNFDKTEMTYIKFKTTIDEVISLFYDNTKKAVNRITVFDEDEFIKLRKNELNLPEDSKRLKFEIYNEHFQYVDSIIKRNEDIITLIDNLILEISKLDDINNQSMENIQILAEMKELIKNTKYYGN